jgi:hypothetical protein
MNQINGVESSFVNESATLIQLSLRPGANPERVAAEATRVLRERAGDCLAVRLSRRDTTVAIKKEEWRDERRVTESLAPQGPAAEEGTPGWGMLLVLLLGCVTVVSWLLWRRYHQMRV